MQQDFQETLLGIRFKGEKTVDLLLVVLVYFPFVYFPFDFKYSQLTTERKKMMLKILL